MIYVIDYIHPNFGPLLFIVSLLTPMLFIYSTYHWLHPYPYYTHIPQLHPFNLVGGIPTPLKNMKVNWDDEIPNIWENKKCSKPPIY